jgi:sugar lactone lactonase YvrE
MSLTGKILCYLSCFLLVKITCMAQVEEFCLKYDTLSTIAGKGDISDKGINGWLSEYEGGSALAAELSRPHFAMADNAGNIFIADKDAHAIRKVSPDGIITTVAGTGVAGDNGDGPATECQLNAPNGIWVTEEGTVYILDLGNNYIRKLNNDGNLTTIFKDSSNISIGRGLWVSQSEDLIYYASNTKVKKWTATGGIVDYSSGYSSLGAIVVDPSGHLVVTDRVGNRVYRVNEDGSKTIIAGNGLSSGGGDGFNATETGIHGVRGIWFMEDKSYLLATHEGSQIWYVDTLGIIHLFLNGREGDENHSGDGEHFQTAGYKISEARGISVDYDGNIIITENDAGYIRRIRYNSDFTQIADKQQQYIYNVNAYPNPFTSLVKIHYGIIRTSFVRIDIYNILGSLITSVTNEIQPPGIYDVYWNATGYAGNKLKKGIYFYHIHTDNISKTGKLVYIE